jgi:hypothetical protein
VDLFSFISLNISIARHGSAIVCVQRRLSADILRACWLAWPRDLSSNIDVDVIVDDGPPAVRCECLVGYFRRRALLEDIVAAGRCAAFESVLLEEAVPLCNTNRRSAGRGAAVKVFMNINVAAASREAVMLLESEMVLFAIAATGRAPGTTAAPSHALEPVAVPTLTSARFVIVIAGKIASGRAIHGSNSWIALLFKYLSLLYGNP